MNKIPYKQGLLAAALTFSIVGSAVAVGHGNAKADDVSTSPSPTTSASPRTHGKPVDVQAKLADAKLKACHKRESLIDNILTRIGTRGEKQIGVFNKIAERTETFYTTKGKTLANYDALVAEVDAKKAAAETAVAEVKADSVSFKCDGTDPKGVGTAIKADLKKEIAALKAYKTAIKNLIVGVKSVQSKGSTTSPSPTVSASPSVSPSPSASPEASEGSN